MVGAFATLASMFKVISHEDFSCIKFGCRSEPAHCYLIEEEEDGKPWYFNIK